MQPILDHLKSRYLNTNLHRTWLDENNYLATFPLWNLSNQLVGYQKYNPKGDKKTFNNPTLGKYYTYRTKPENAVWGLESWNVSNPLFVTEGIFDAARLTWNNMSAIAVMSNDPSDTIKNWLWTIRKFRPVIAVCDNDAAGRKLAKFGTYSEVVEGHDLGDASNEYVDKLIKKYT